jgi:hypothetical protein
MSKTNKTEDCQVRICSEGQWKLQVKSYRLADKFFCLVDNVDPGARLVLAEGFTRKEAEEIALEKAKQMLQRTRVFH